MERIVVLKRGDTLQLAHAAGCTVEVRGADVWVTQLGDARDQVMRFGKMRLESGGCALVYAFDEANVTVDAPPAAVIQVRRGGVAAFG
jgi:hypothetical protein